MLNKAQKIKTGAAALLLLASFGLPTLIKADTYTVKSGDTLSKIAKQYNTSIEAIVNDNQISDAHFISVGQTLEIKSSTSAATTEVTAASPNDSDAAAKEEIAQRESGGSYTAQNGQYYGRYQLSISYLNGDLSPENQEKVADSYVTERYGSWSAALAFWNTNGWY